MIKLLQKLLGIENFEYRLRRLERAQYWRENIGINMTGIATFGNLFDTKRTSKRN